MTLAMPEAAPVPTEDCHALTIRSVRWWSPTLFSLVMDRPESLRFIAGQFARLGLPVDGEWVWRAYSIVSSPYDEHLEFLSIVVEDGVFTQALKQIREGDTLYVDRRNFGTLTCDRFRGQPDLWLFATGTGLAPFVSILRDPYTWETFGRLVLVHSVRNTNELAYREAFENFRDDACFGEFAERFHYVKVVTRDDCAGAYQLRIPELVQTGILESGVGFELSHARSAVMMCGNPAMLRQMKTVLADRGLTVNRKASPGNILWENGFLPEDNKQLDL